MKNVSTTTRRNGETEVTQEEVREIDKKANEIEQSTMTTTDSNDEEIFS